MRASEPAGAAAIARETGRGGRVVYFPWNIGEIFWEVMAIDHGRLIAQRRALGAWQSSRRSPSKEAASSTSRSARMRRRAGARRC